MALRAELAESTTNADGDSCVCDTRGLHTWFVRLLKTSMDATLRSEDQSTPVLRSAAPVLWDLRSFRSVGTTLNTPNQVHCNHAQFLQAVGGICKSLVRNTALQGAQSSSADQAKSQPLAVGMTRLVLNRNKQPWQREGKGSFALGKNYS